MKVEMTQTILHTVSRYYDYMPDLGIFDEI